MTNLVRKDASTVERSGEMTVAGIPGRTDGVAPAAGYVGERVAFTSTSIPAVIGAMTANGTPLVTLGAGSWQLFPTVSCSTPASITGIFVAVSSNSTNDGSGLLSTYSGVASSVINVGVGLPPLTLNLAAASTPYYAKAQTAGANATVVVTGYAIRIA